MDTLFALMMIHTDFMDRIFASTMRLHMATEQNKIDLIDFESNNRERLINIIEQIQFSIEERLNTFFTQDYLEEVTPILKAWANDMGLWLEKVNAIDDLTTEGLELLKEETTKEIAVIYRAKENFKGYNLNTIKK